jgi:hypothetical protein
MLSLKGTSGDRWNMTVYDSGGDVTVSVELEDGTTAECSTTIDDPRIDVTGGTLGGEPCTALRVADGTEMYYGTDVDSRYDIVFFNGTQIRGTYEGTIRDASQIDAQNDETVLYSGTVRYVYETREVTYKTNITVAPGEPP